MLHAHPVDPRDQRYEFDDPSYRVFFWSQPQGTGPDAMWHSDEWEITGSDIDEVLAWVHEHGGGRRASLWVATGGGDEVTHTRLAGSDPTASDDTWPGWADEDWPRRHNRTRTADRGPATPVRRTGWR